MASHVKIPTRTTLDKSLPAKKVREHVYCGLVGLLLEFLAPLFPGIGKMFTGLVATWCKTGCWVF